MPSVIFGSLFDEVVKKPVPAIHFAVFRTMSCSLGSNQWNESFAINLLKLYNYKPTFGDLFMCNVSQISTEIVKLYNQGDAFPMLSLKEKTRHHHSKHLFIGDDEGLIAIHRDHLGFIEIPFEIPMYEPFPLAHWSGILGHVKGYFNIATRREQLMKNVTKSTVQNFFIHDVLHTSFTFQHQTHYLIFDHDQYDAQDDADDEILFERFKIHLQQHDLLTVFSWPSDLVAHTTKPIYTDRECITCLRNCPETHYLMYIR